MTDFATPISAEDHVDGAPGANLELVMYGDFQCPYSAAAHPIVRRVRERLAGRLSFAFRHFPLRDIHPDAQRAAEASEVAAAQGAFCPIHVPRVQRDVDSRLASGVGGTPSFFVNGRLHRGSFDAASLIVVIER